MLILVGLMIAVMVLFAAFTARSEILLYRKAVKGEVKFLVSAKRRNRRLLISAILVLEAAFLFLGFFVLNGQTPLQALLFWLPPMLLILVLIWLGLSDLKETRKNIDRILVETCLNALQKARNRKE